MLSSEDVQKLAKTRRLLNPFDPRRMGPCSYDLAVGEEYYCYQPADGNRFVLRRLGAGDPEACCEIPPNGCAFILTEESLSMPSNLVGQIALRFSLTKKGVMLSPQAPIDPGYCGKVMMMLYNLSDEPQFFHRGDPFVTISFHELTSVTAPYEGVNQGGTTIRAFMKRDLPIRTSISRTEADLIQGARDLRLEVEESRKSLEERFQDRMQAIDRRLTWSFITALAAVAIAAVPIVQSVVASTGSDSRPSPVSASPSPVTPSPTSEASR